MGEAGVGWVRSDFAWPDFQAEADTFEFGPYDRLVESVTDAGLKLLATLTYTPACLGAWNQAPEPESYARWTRQVVRRYKGTVQHWEVWHEPDSVRFWTPQDHMQAYVTLLKQTYTAIKKEDDTAVVHLGGLGQALPKSLKEVYALGGIHSFDVVNAHPFVHPLMPDAIGGLRYFYESIYRVMKENGDTLKPLWLTSIGCPGIKAPQQVPDWWLGKNPSEAQQAEWVRTLYEKVLLWPGVTKIFWSFFRDTENVFGNGTDYSGLIRKDFSKKPAFEAYLQATTSFQLR